MSGALTCNMYEGLIQRPQGPLSVSMLAYAYPHILLR